MATSILARAIVGASLAAISLAAHAADDPYVGLHLMSAHYPKRTFQQSVTPGVYVLTGSGLTFGAYHNTVDRWSVYAGQTIQLSESIDLTVGVVTGYKRRTEVVPGYTMCPDHRAPPCTLTRGFMRHNIGPLLAPSVRLPEIAGIRPRISFLPGSDCVAIHLSVERRF